MTTTVRFAAAYGKANGLERREIDAYATATPGLVVHGYIQPHSGETTKRNAWVVSHVASGFALDRTTFHSRALALQVAARLGEGIDWTREAKDLRDDPQVRLSVTAAYKGALISRPSPRS